MAALGKQSYTVIFSRDGDETASLQNCSPQVPIIRPQDDKRNKLYCTLMELLTGNDDVLGENPVQVPLFPPQTPHKPR